MWVWRTRNHGTSDPRCVALTLPAGVIINNPVSSPEPTSAVASGIQKRPFRRESAGVRAGLHLSSLLAVRDNRACDCFHSSKSCSRQRTHLPPRLNGAGKVPSLILR